MSRYRAVVFDLWDTLVLWPADDGNSFHRWMAGHVGADEDRFSEAWIAAYDQRATGPLEPSVLTVCRELGVPEDRLETLIRARIEFTRRALVPRAGAVEVLQELRRRGLRLGLISVCSEEVPTLWEDTPLATLIDEAVFSCSVGVMKPDRRIYELAAERLGIEPDGCLFIDDRTEFVEGARAAGMDAHVLGQPPVERLEDVLELVQ